MPGRHLTARLGNDLFRGAVSAKASTGSFKQLPDPPHLTQRQGFDLAERVVQPQFIPHAALQRCGPDSEGARRRGRTLFHPLPVSLHGLPRGPNQPRIPRLRPRRLEESSHARQQRHTAFHGLFHDPQPYALGAADRRCGLVQKVRRLPEQRAQVGRRPPRLLVSALQLVEQDIQQMIRRIRFQRMPAPGIILAFLQQQAAQRQPVKLLLVRQLPRRNPLQRAQRPLPLALALAVERRRQPPQLPLALAQAGADGAKDRVVVQQRLKVAREQPLKLSASAGHGLINARNPHPCTNQFGAAHVPTPQRVGDHRSRFVVSGGRGPGSVRRSGPATCPAGTDLKRFGLTIPGSKPRCTPEPLHILTTSSPHPHRRYQLDTSGAFGCNTLYYSYLRRFFA